jgi:hypothetical protein
MDGRKQRLMAAATRRAKFIRHCIGILPRTREYHSLAWALEIERQHNPDRQAVN